MYKSEFLELIELCCNLSQVLILNFNHLTNWRDKFRVIELIDIISWICANFVRGLSV